MISSAMVRAYCHKGTSPWFAHHFLCSCSNLQHYTSTVIKLSDTLQTYAAEKECTTNVHGVRSEFIEEGRRRSEANLQKEKQAADSSEHHRVYFIGKLLWAKGLDKMLELQEYYRQYTGDYFPIDVFGSGPEENEIQRAFHGRQKQERKEAESLQELAKLQLAKLKDTVSLPKSFAELRKDPIPAAFPGRVDHAVLKEDYTVFINPSFSEVLCTTTFEALAMGKFAIIPYHPSNMFFLRFPNALIYRDPYEFVANVRWAMYHDPEPLTPEQVREFTWEAATDRLINSAAITHGEALERERIAWTTLDERIAWFHNEIGKGTKGDILRKVFGAGPASDQVKYQTESSLVSNLQEDSAEEMDGLSGKFRKSSFAEAIRKSLLPLVP
jgi:digalactosyldiacylglycerol synthase